MASSATANAKFVSGDTGPSLFGTLTDNDGAVIDLTSAAVRFQMRESIDHRFAVDAFAVIVDAATGSVRYDWQPGDLDVPGDYLSRWQITFLDDTRERTIPANTITIETP